jgi:hypothetical protein
VRYTELSIAESLLSITHEMDGAGDAMGVVPAHTYARLRFDEAAEQAVQHLSNVLQWHRGSPYEGQFVSQMEPRAGTSPSSKQRYFLESQQSKRGERASPKESLVGGLGMWARLAGWSEGFPPDAAQGVLRCVGKAARSAAGRRYTV